ncbi:DUF6962 family protein [Actinomycetospora sp. TBRC 11914]|uniref:DUF6962 family protein n=1 Tax=Actinomycetospora sp. TBRC 11914 TaxID=2729387 RepID=UPI00145CECAE|nr:hypothetical protein [Actinomycetospora sp. TBRC 11914]NMO93550.1 hypothetical protein [Actinomycetospora sp. TBRC 11914]
MLLQPLASLTDLALGLVTLYLWPRVPRDVEGAKYWRAAFAWTAVTALIGAVYHGFLVGDPRWGQVTWAVMSIMVVVVMSYLLAATVVQVLGPTRAIVFWPLRLIGFIAYAVIAVTGHPSIMAIMWCESLTMACVVGLWVWAWWQGHPAGGAVLVAIGVSIVGALFRLVPGATDLLRIDPDSAYHIGQVAGMVLLARAVAHGRPSAAVVAGGAGAGEQAADEVGGAATRRD